MLSKKCQYALHALMYITDRKEKTTQVSEIVQSKKIPKKFLETILLELKNKGILESKQGKGGGYYLRRDPGSVSILEIVRMMDGAVAMLPCVSIKYYEPCGMCDNEATCSIRGIFEHVRDETLNVLSKTYLSDLLLNKPALNRLIPFKLG